MCLATIFTSVTPVFYMLFLYSQQLETDLKIEREWRQTLQNDLDRERDTVAQLSTEALQIKRLKKVKKKQPNIPDDDDLLDLYV